MNLSGRQYISMYYNWPQHISKSLNRSHAIEMWSGEFKWILVGANTLQCISNESQLIVNVGSEFQCIPIDSNGFESIVIDYNETKCILMNPQPLNLNSMYSNVCLWFLVHANVLQYISNESHCISLHVNVFIRIFMSTYRFSWIPIDYKDSKCILMNLIELNWIPMHFI